MKSIISKLAMAGIVVVIFGTLYAVVQQAQRNDANYPQIQIAEDTAADLNHAQAPTVYGDVDMQTSLASFTIIYDKAGRVVVGSGYIKGKVPKAPLGILTAAKGHEYHAVTWQPEKNVRLAAVSVAAKDYYVLSGRSLREVEKNETQTLQLAVAGGIIALLLLAVAIVAKLLRNEYASPGNS